MPRSVDREDVHGKYPACRRCEVTFTRVIDALGERGGGARVRSDRAGRPSGSPSRRAPSSAPGMQLGCLSGARLLEMFDGDGGSALTVVNADGFQTHRAVLVRRAPRPSGGRRSIDQDPGAVVEARGGRGAARSRSRAPMLARAGRRPL